MTYRLIVLFLLFASTMTSVHAQKKFSRTQIDTSLTEIEALVESDPIQASELLRKKLKQRNLENYPDFLIRAYILLGDIYINIDQKQLAVERYEQAWKYTDMNMVQERRTILIKKGNALLDDNPKLAKQSFQSCLAMSINNEMQAPCKEGLADALMAQDSASKAIPIYQQIESFFLGNNQIEDVVRIQAKMANTYLSMKDDVQAQMNYNNAYSNAQKAPPRSKKSQRAYEKASEGIISNESDQTNIENIRSQNIILNKENPRQKAVEQLKLAELYVTSNQPQLALKTLSAASETVDKIEAPDLKASISKKSAEAYALRGEFEKAFDALGQYEQEQQAILTTKEKELDRQITIVENQRAIDLDQKDYINQANEASYESNLLSVQKYIIGLLSLLLFLAAISFYFIWKNVKAKNKANQLLELKGLRAQMNPHFLFNALNTVNEYIATKDERQANQYLSDFSTLMRNIVEHSQHDLISLRDELEATKLYLELEHRRFQEKFDFTFDVPDELPQTLQVPPLLFQPYLENAIWHGLRYKENKGQLNFRVTQNKDSIHVVIEDNGIGRKNSIARKTVNQKKYTSTGLKNTSRRMKLINELFGQTIDVSISDLDASHSDQGTRVDIRVNA